MTSTTTRTSKPSRHELTEIRWHGRGGQGAVTAAKMVAEVALGQNRYFQAFPEYGPERSGAPIVAFTRISDEPIQVYSGVEHPDIVVVLDPSLLSIVDVTSGAPDDAIVLVNSDLPPAQLRARSNLQGRRLYTVAATKIATETIGRPIPNTPMVGALVRITGMFPIEDVVEFLRADFSKKFSPKVVEGNIKALMRSYEEVQAE
ncbi:MAG TPA: 2-oxoacid:acceptor oxidoreductase family protein [Thermoleophilia bacterium]|nr:2-oxoacid:acceptor oxidoreductase family protein [Thermoleophilia bacterium]